MINVNSDNPFAETSPALPDINKLSLSPDSPSHDDTLLSSAHFCHQEPSSLDSDPLPSDGPPP